MTAEAVELLPPALGERGEAYDRWLKARQEPSEEYLRSETRVRFEARDDDVLVALPGVGAVRAPGGAELRGGPLSRAIALPGVDAEVARRFLAALSGESSLAEACRASGLAGDARGALLAAAFGVTLFAPFAVTELERRVSGVELVRFPGAPYEIERPYWQNMAAVRDRAPELEAALGEPLAALATLSRLHVVALIGERGDSFYRPASRVAQNGVSPGALWHTAPRTSETPAGTRFLAGPRVHVPLLGGSGYGALLAELSGDPEATLGRRQHVEAGLDWGRIVTASAEGDREPLPWFCPPRPITLAHVTALFASLQAAVAAAAARQRTQALHALADFHQRFVRLHPFRACNQALVMNLVNAVLGRVMGAGMPHLVLDHVALRFAPLAYRRIFALAAEEWCVADAPAPRLARLLEKKRDYYALVQQLSAATDADAARIAAEMSPAAARLAFLSFD